MASDGKLVVRRRINAPVEQVFAAWTEPSQLKQWWGPVGVTCPEAKIDLREGGSYRIANLRPDKSLTWISGTFIVMRPPHELRYTWIVDGDLSAASEVRVEFKGRSGATDVIVTHLRHANRENRNSRRAGWQGCLDKLAAFLA